MVLLAGTPFRSLFPPSAVAAPRRTATAPPPLAFHRRSPLTGALLFLSLGGVAGVRSFSSAQMESASTTVPSIVVYVTVPNREAGKKLAGSIISEKLAACVNIVPGVESVYWWEGKVQSDAEELLIIKTRESLLDALTEHVKANHEYDVPEVIALPIKGGNLKYLEWLKNSTREN
ncbi:hypothetical protein SEVIR_9G251500v4 [Setaria viridis]|uniref:Protein CutA, chloroplastic n=2 Tax=Setaria TaxID=4554 RepID=K4AFU8_SETIT|nr:protein CutA 1, chloroplastic isoform X2 [Setaria italica]XP_034573679.1 protein CutA 1, chloroplastic isoform X2 [Setaria viridis]RCV42855.1 hypothetical protein SETIT_9G248900v2 [Setaria italica]TKV93784.1 hypothetical protein SEVIR_9G251500v2 [Setaria viridis]